MRLKGILENIQEKHDFSDAPEELEVPDVNNSHDKFYHVDTTKNWGLYKEDPSETSKWIKTARALTLVDVDHVRDFLGAAGENRKWNKVNGEWYFGNYHIDDWEDFLNDLTENGLSEPITIDVRKSGKAVLTSGNHRLAAYDLLGLNKIPAFVFWSGGIQGSSDDPMKKYYDELKNESE